jgi:tetratricopeptide (TPR) repeat protein
VFSRILIIGLLVLSGARTANADASTVLVLPFENLSDRNLDWIGEGIAERIVERLDSQPRLQVFSRDARLVLYDRFGIPPNSAISRATGLKLAWEAGADIIVSGTFTATAEALDVEARIVDVALFRSFPPGKFRGKPGDILPLTNSLAFDLLRKLLPATAALEANNDTNDTMDTPAIGSAFESYIRGMLNPDPQKQSDFFEEAVRLRPQYPDAIFQLGRLLHAERRFTESNTWLQRLGATGPDPVQSQFIIVLNHIYLSEYDPAIRILASLPETYNVLIARGVALANQADQSGMLAALDVWKRAAEMNPLCSEAFFNIGYVSLIKGNLSEAVNRLDQFLKLQGRDAEALFLLARVYERLGRSEESQRTMSQAVRLSQRVDRWWNQPLPKLERLRTAADLPSVEWTPARLARRAKGQDVDQWVESVQKLVDSELYGEALGQLQEMTRVFPVSSDAHLLKAQIYFRQRDYDRAVEEINATLRLEPGDTAALKLKKDLEDQSPSLRNHP